MNIKYVKKANMWCFSKTFNKSGTSDVIEWFSTEKEALERLRKEFSK